MAASASSNLSIKCFSLPVWIFLPKTPVSHKTVIKWICHDFSLVSLSYYKSVDCDVCDGEKRGHPSHHTLSFQSSIPDLPRTSFCHKMPIASSNATSSHISIQTQEERIGVSCLFFLSGGAELFYVCPSAFLTLLSGKDFFFLSSLMAYFSLYTTGQNQGTC